MPIDEKQICEVLRKRLIEPLPGKDAHVLMKPEGRGLLLPETSNPRLSAVLLLLYVDEGVLKITLIKRAVYDGIHSGQFAFPGGKKEPIDRNLLQTALREANEEVGVHISDVNILGELSPLYIPVSNMLVHPWVGFHRAKPIFVKQEKEVQQVLPLDLSMFLDGSVIAQSLFEGANYRVEAPCYQVNGYKIWGATAMILSEFIEIFKQAVPA